MPIPDVVVRVLGRDVVDDRIHDGRRGVEDAKLGGTVPLLMASGYWWERQANERLSSPVGWLYLFQPEQYWDSLVDRVANNGAWEASGINGELQLEPDSETYGWAGRTAEGDGRDPEAIVFAVAGPLDMRRFDLRDLERTQADVAAELDNQVVPWVPAARPSSSSTSSVS